MKPFVSLIRRGGCLAVLLLSACAPHEDVGELVVQPIQTDAAAVQAAAPPSTGRDDPGQPSGLFAYYSKAKPTKLVVFCHGLGQTVEGAWAAHIRRTVRPDVAVVATNYRDNLRFPLLRGAQDTIAATLMAKERFPSIEQVYLLGVSMGGAVSGIAIAESVHAVPEGDPLFDYWVDVEGLSNVVEAYGEAAVALPQVAADLEDETGGTPLSQPAAYQRRSPALRGLDLRAAGLKAAVVIHAVNDGLVVYNNGREMADALVAAAIPTQFFTVLRNADGQTSGTTGTGFFSSVLGIDDPNDATNLAGHGFEGDLGHPVIRTGFEQLELMLRGDYDDVTPYLEHVVDDGG